ncbi:MAG: Arc family DNA-binding protein [Cypionkella sp.]
MAKDDPHFRLRIPAQIKDGIEDLARRNERSINAEIVYRLMQSLGDAPEGPKWTLHVPEDLQKRIALAAQRHGVSANDEVLNVLLELYPAPRTAAAVARELERMAEVLSPASSVEEVQRLVSKLQALAVHIYNGRAPDVDEAAQEKVADLYERHGEEDLKDFSRPFIGTDDV